MATTFSTPDLPDRPAYSPGEDEDEKLAALLAMAHAEIQDLTSRLAAGQITVAEWRAEMENILATYHRAAWVLGAGEEPDEDGLQRLAEYLAEELEYLAGFAKALADEPEGSAISERYRRRAEQYVFAMRGSYSRGATGAYDLPGYPGSRVQCGRNCLCSWRLDVLDAEAGDVDAYWLLGVADHCATCQARADGWRPFSIRGFEWAAGNAITPDMYA